MQTNAIEDTMLTLLQTGLLAVGCRIPAERDDSAIYLRNLVVVITDLGRIECFDMTSPDTPIMVFPVEATQSAAAAIVIHVLTGLVTRAIEADEAAAL